MTIGATVRAAAAMGVCAATLLGAGCGSEGTDAASTQRAAADFRSPLVCPNVRSTAAALRMESRIGDVIFTADGVRCEDWSETGNPTRYSGRAIDDGTTQGTAFWGLQPANGKFPTFRVSFRTYPGNVTVGSLWVQLTTTDTVAGWLPTRILTRAAFGDPWKSNASHVFGELDGKKVRVVTGVISNPKDGTWDSPNGSGAAEDAWFMTLQFAS